MNTTKCDVLVDDNFMNKDVSELIANDFYLFHTTGNKTYLYKDGCIGVGYVDEKSIEGFYSVPYTQGTLQEYVDKLGDVDE